MKSFRNQLKKLNQRASKRINQFSYLFVRSMNFKNQNTLVKNNTKIDEYAVEEEKKNIKAPGYYQN